MDAAPLIKAIPDATDAVAPAEALPDEADDLDGLPLLLLDFFLLPPDEPEDAALAEGGGFFAPPVVGVRPSSLAFFSELPGLFWDKLN